LTELFKGKYQVVNQILAKGLHNADQESIAYTTRLMDDLEQVRAPHLCNSHSDELMDEDKVQSRQPNQ
jgi:vacuolar protein sorting-associated protein VTA1